MSRAKKRIELNLVIGYVILLSCCQDNQKAISTYKNYYPSGELEVEISMKDSLLHGLSTTYYKSGQIKYEKYYFEDVPTNHHYYYSEQGDLLAYNFYDVRGQLRYQLFADSLTDSYSEDGKILYIQGEFEESYNIGDTVSLIPIVANPFKSNFNIILLTESESIRTSRSFVDSNSLLFLYLIEAGNNPIKVISEVTTSTGNVFRKDTVALNFTCE